MSHEISTENCSNSQTIRTNHRRQNGVVEFKWKWNYHPQAKLNLVLFAPSRRVICLWPLVLLFPKLWIIWLSNLSMFSVHDESYFERTWWKLFWMYLMKVILNVPDESYFECTWWKLFWTYLMKVIPEMRRAH